MPVFMCNEEVLRKILYEYPVSVVFNYTENNLKSRELMPVFNQLAENKAFKNAAFVAIDVDKEFISQGIPLTRNVPFISIYKRGLLVECRSFDTKENLIEILNQTIKN